MLPDLCPDLTRIENPITPIDGTRESTFEKSSRNVTESKEYAMPDELKTDFDFFQEEFRAYRGLEFNEFQHLYIYRIFINCIKYNLMPIFNDAIGQTAQVGFQNDHLTNQRIRSYESLHHFENPFQDFIKFDTRFTLLSPTEDELKNLKESVSHPLCCYVKLHRWGIK